MFFQLVFHYITIIFMQDYIPLPGGLFEEDSPALELAYMIAGL